MLTSIPNFGEFREIVRTFVTRSQAALQTDYHELDVLAINNAMMAAQRQHDFEWNKTEVYCDLNPNADILTDMKSLEDDSAVVVKRINRAFRLSTNGTQYPVDYISREALINRLKTRLNLNQIGTEETDTTGVSGNLIVHHGQKVSAYPQATVLPERVNFDAIIYQPRFTLDTDTNFLLQHGYDYLLYRSIVELNFLLKEDDRFEINVALVRESWDALVDWDVRLVGATETEVDL